MSPLNVGQCQETSEPTPRTGGVNGTVRGAGIAAELNRLAALPANWDQFGAPRIEPEIIAAATAFLAALPEFVGKPPRVVPMSAGNLQLEWHRGPRVLELEFENPRTIRFLQYDPSAGVEEEDSFPANDTDRAVRLIEWFTNEAACP